MEKFFKALSYPGKWILIIGGFVFAALWGLSYASFSGGFLPTVSSLIIGIVGLCVLCVVPVMLLLKKDEIAKMVFYVLVGYWLINGVINNFGNAAFAAEGAPWYSVLFGIWTFIYGSLMLAILVFIVLSIVVKKPLFRQLVGLGLMALIVWGLLTMIWGLIMYAEWEYPWSSFVNLIANYLLAPVLVLCGALVFLFRKKAE